jgi:hypothetical protein
LKPEQWGSPLVQEKYQEERLWQDTATVIIIIIIIIITRILTPVFIFVFALCKMAAQSQKVCNA